jgi:peptidoglycan/xylan/chitin deacetylase (PgdA/CDA1 family)
MFQDILYRLKRFRQRKAVILVYHQICERKDDPWELAVHPNHFHSQLEYLKRNFEVLPMADLVDGVVSHKLRKAVAVTFDDGFKDNYSNAAPLLDWTEVPATFYVATTAMQDGKVYWWDALQHIVFDSHVLPQRLEIDIAGERVQFPFCLDNHILNPRLINQIHAWNFNLPIPNERVALYMMLWHRIKPLGYAQQNAVIDQIRDWARCGEVAYREGATMSVHEMQMLDQNPLFTIGAHSVHHALLSQRDPVEQAYEVTESKRQIEKWLGKPVNGFAYPYGNYSEVTQKLLKESGFRYAVSTESKAVTEEDDPFALPRIQVKNWSVYEFASKINEMIHE